MERRRQTSWGLRDLKQHGGKVTPSFRLTQPRLGAEEAAYRETPTVVDSCDQGTRKKGWSSKMENFQMMTVLLHPDTLRNTHTHTGPNPTHPAKSNGH